MLKRTAITFLCIFLLCGCENAKRPPAAIKIGNISITQAEFERAFKTSPYSIADTQESRKEFLDNYITRLLILKEAESLGLNKDPEFMRSVEAFWQQSLIKMMLDRKIKKVSGAIEVSDDEIAAYYNTRKTTEFKDRDMKSVYDNIKWRIANDKNEKALGDWLGSLKKSSKVEIDYKMLKINE